MIVKINGTTIKTPHSLDIEKYKLTKASRVASGKMHMDLIAKKRKFNFEYEVLKGSELDKIVDILDSSAIFFTLEYQENGVTKTATVYAGAIHASKFRTNSGWYWKKVRFSLIEQ